MIQDTQKTPRDANQSLADIPGLDVEKGLDVFDGEMDDYMAALQSYAKNAPVIIDKLRGFIKDGVAAEKLPGYAIDIHGLKSISAWICAENIREGALELELLAKAGDISAVTARNETFLNNAEKFINDLKPLLEKSSGD